MDLQSPVMFQKIHQFLTLDVWRLRRSNLPRGKSIALKVLRVFLYATKGFNEDKCSLSAAALTFLTLFSIVPLFAMAFGIAKGFGLEQRLQEQLFEQAQGQEEVFNWIIGFSKRMLESTSGGLIAGIGVVILFFTVIRLLSNIEISLNGIWGVKEHRTWVRKFSDYLSIMIVCPVLLVLASSINVFIVSQVTLISENVEFVGFFSKWIFFALKVLPFMVMWMLFSFLYVVVPNTRVNILAGIIGGITGGTIYQLFQAIYLNVLVGVTSYSAVYGSFAALPLFLFWLQSSWLIMLFGAEVSFAYQNADTYELEPDCLRASQWFRRLSALLLASVVIRAFSRGEGPVGESALLKELELPVRLVKELLFQLVEVGVLFEVKRENNRELSYLPGRDIKEITVGFVLHRLEMHGLSDIPIRHSAGLERLREMLQSYENRLLKAPLDAPLVGIEDPKSSGEKLG
jgi:membrane protein